MLNNQQTIKSTNMKAVMKNPKLVQLISEVLEAPLGSTKREKAKAVLSSLNKNKQNSFQDGQGGSPYDGLGMSSVATGPTPSASSYLPKQQPTAQPTAQPTEQPKQIASEQPTYPGYESPYPQLNERVDVVPGIPLPDKNNIASSDTNQPPYGSTLEGISKWYKESPEEVSNWLTTISGTEPIGVTTDVTKPDSIPTDMWSSLKENVEGGVGEESWKYYALPKLKEWFPDVPEQDLPIGAIWTDEIPAIKERLDEEYQLNSLLDNVNKLDSQGLTIEDDLQAYVRGRDEYIKNINKMIDNVNNVYVDKDVSDPRVRNMLDKYRSYLYMSKGRQEVRYTDYVNRSIKEHEVRLERATDTYNNGVKQFESALSDEKDMTEERYDMYSDMLKDLYTSLDDRQTEIVKIGDNELAKLTESLKNAADIKQYLQDLSGETSDDDIELSNANLNTSLNNYIESHSNNPNIESEWKALNNLDKRKWMTSREFNYDEMVKEIKSAQDDNLPYDDIKEMIENAL